MTDRQERATSFGSIAEDYDGLRPQPPRQAVDWLAPPHCRVALDLGAGTGVFTRMLADKAAEVIAVEPDARMRAVLIERSPDVRAVEGTGESIPLPDVSADAVFVSSAWHWMDPHRAVPEIGRVLRDGGRFGLIWTSRDRDVDWVRDLDLLPGEDTPEADSPDRFRRRHENVVLPDPQIFDNIARETFTFVRTMKIDDVVAMVGTYSRVIIASPAERAERLANARSALHERFPGAEAIDVPMKSRCWRADRIPRASTG